MTTPTSTSTRVWLFGTAFLAGAVVMALEILGSRLLAPVFGNSLFVWGALIGVILAAMSSGYATAGWLSDRHSPGAVLSLLLLISGVWTFLLAWLGQPVMFKIVSWIDDPRWGPSLAAAILLGPPAFGLSGALPPLLRLAIADVGHLGWHTGGMIAVSTIGSLVGTWGTAFFLLSWLGGQALVAGFGVIQVLLGLLWWWRTVTVRAPVAAPVVIGLAVLGWFAVHPVQVLPAPVYQEDSPYQQVRVRDDDLLRYLILDRTFHAVMWRADPVDLFLPYSQLMMVALALVPEASETLILGHGGGSLAKWLAQYRPDLHVDAVEVDPAVAAAAERHFEYRPPETHHVYVKDARTFLRGTTKMYDVIWMDCFARHLIPFHLTTQEFFEEVRAHLKPDGILAVNLSSGGERPDQLRAEAVVSTLKTVFPVFESYGVKGPWKTSNPDAQNFIFFAGTRAPSMTDPAFVQRVAQWMQERRLPPEALTLLASRRTADWPAGTVLTDDFAPFDLLIGH